MVKNIVKCILGVSEIQYNIFSLMSFWCGFERNWTQKNKELRIEDQKKPTKDRQN